MLSWSAPPRSDESWPRPATSSERASVTADQLLAALFKAGIVVTHMWTQQNRLGPESGESFIRKHPEQTNSFGIA